MRMRTIRAVLRTGLIWGIAWALIGAMIGVATFLRSVPLGDATMDLFFGYLGAPVGMLCACGLVSGVFFSTAVAWLERGRTLDTFPGWRAAGWGAVAVFFVSQVIVGMIALTFGVSDALQQSLLRLSGLASLCGALSAAGSLAIARKGTPGLLEEAAALQRLRAPATPGTETT
jgi:hypothetical protein